jgi:hypothetical protein
MNNSYYKTRGERLCLIVYALTMIVDGVVLLVTFGAIDFELRVKWIFSETAMKIEGKH